jgi:hypothetical protein
MNASVLIRDGRLLLCMWLVYLLTQSLACSAHTSHGHGFLDGLDVWALVVDGDRVLLARTGTVSDGGKPSEKALPEDRSASWQDVRPRLRGLAGSESNLLIIWCEGSDEKLLPEITKECQIQGIRFVVGQPAGSAAPGCAR